MSICAYCDTSCSPTREHVIPDWYCRTPGESDTFSARNPTTHVKGDVVVKDVCEKCNSGVLSRLDAYGKQLYDSHFLKFVYAGDSVSIPVDASQLIRWLLKLSYNSARSQNADHRVLREFRNIILGQEPLTGHVRCWAHLISSSIVNEKENVLRPALASETRDEFHPAWFRIAQIRLPYRPTCRVLQRQVIINSYAFTLLVAPRDEIIPCRDLDELTRILPAFVPDVVPFAANCERLILKHQTDHAGASVKALVKNYSTRFDESPNAHVKDALDGKLQIIFLSVTPEMIAEGDLDSLSLALRAMVASREMELAHRLRVGIMVIGFDNDPRPLWEIEDVREFFRDIFQRCPFVFLLSHPDGGLLKLLAACWVYEKADMSQEGQKRRTEEFLNRAFAGLNTTAYRLAISDEVNREISKIGMMAIQKT